MIYVDRSKNSGGGGEVARIGATAPLILYIINHYIIKILIININNDDKIVVKYS